MRPGLRSRCTAAVPSTTGQVAGQAVPSRRRVPSRGSVTRTACAGTPSGVLPFAADACSPARTDRLVRLSDARVLLPAVVAVHRRDALRRGRLSEESGWSSGTLVVSSHRCRRERRCRSVPGGANRPACAAAAGEITEFLHRLARLSTGPRRRPRRAAALSAFGIVLHHGWRIIYLGADTRLADLVHTVAEKRADVVILAAVTPERFQESIPDLVALARTAPLRLAGAGATTSIADTVGATILAGDPITEAQRLTPLS